MEHSLEAWPVIASLGRALETGSGSLSSVSALLKRVIKEELWRSFPTPRGETVTHDKFVTFLTEPPLHGLGATYDLVRRIVADDLEAIDLLDQAVKVGPGGDHSKSDNIIVAPNGTAQDQALRKLRKDRPDLHAEVLAGRLSAHAAMVDAGFRHRTATVRCDDAKAAVRTLLKHYTASELLDAIEEQP